MLRSTMAVDLGNNAKPPCSGGPLMVLYTPVGSLNWLNGKQHGPLHAYLCRLHMLYQAICRRSMMSQAGSSWCAELEDKAPHQGSPGQYAAGGGRPALPSGGTAHHCALAGSL